MFNVRPEALIPWLHVEPPPADEVPGFRMNPDGSIRDTKHGAASGSFGIGMPPGTPTAHYANAAQALGQPTLRVPTPSSELLAQSIPPTGLAGFRVRLEDNVPGFNLVSNGSDVQPRQAPPPSHSDTVPTQTPPSANDLTQLIPPQLSEWLYKLVTMPVPQLSTVFDPQTGRRIVPYEPLTGPIRSYLRTDENSRGTEDINPTVEGTSRLPDRESAEAPTTEQQPSSDTPAWPMDIITDARATTGVTPEVTTGNAWPQPPVDGWPPYAETGGASEVPWPSVVMPQPVGVAPAPSVQPVAESNFIPANTGDADDPQAVQPTPLPQDQPTELKNSVTPTELPVRPPEHRTEHALSRSIEDYRRTTADEIEELVGSIATFGSRIYEDSILEARDDLARLAERLRNDPGETALSILNSFPQTRVEGKFVGGLAAVLTILANAKRGLEFERTVLHALNDVSRATKINKNTSKIGIEGLGRSVPDVLHRGIREIKSGVEIDNSIQLRVQAAYARLVRVPFSLIVSPTTQRISKPVRDAVRETGGTIQRFDPATGVFTPFQ